MKVLSQDDILNADDMRTEFVPTPEWGGDGAGVYIKTLSGEARDKWHTSVLSNDGKVIISRYPRARLDLVAMCMCNADGVRIIEPGKEGALGKKSAAVLNRIFVAAQKLNGIDVEEEETLKKTFEQTESDDSGLA